MEWIIGWILLIAGILLFAGYAAFTLRMAGLGVAMSGRTTPASKWSVLGLWLILMAAPVRGPIVWPVNRLGYRVPGLGAPFGLGSSRRPARPRAARRR
jgi:hypothetical protein